MYQNFGVYQNFNVSKCIKIINFFKYSPKCTYVIYKCIQVYLNWFHSFKLCLSVLKCITNNPILQNVSKWITCIKILQMYLNLPAKYTFSYFYIQNISNILLFIFQHHFFIFLKQNIFRAK